MKSGSSNSLWRGRAAVRLALAVALVAATAGEGHASDCPDKYDFPATIDFYDPEPFSQVRIGTIESNHMNENVRSLRRGQTGSTASGDLRFVLTVVPNHPRALELLMRMALRDNKEKLPEAERYSVECWLHRATVFRPTDGTAFLIYGTYLARRGKVEQAISALETANSLRPDDVNIAYNLGLLYFEKKDYERSRDYAKKAYDAGFPLRGLKDKLQQVGQWRD